MSDEPKQNFPTFAEIVSLPEPEVTTETRTFSIGGRDWTFEIRTDGRSSGEQYALLTEQFGVAWVEKDAGGVKVMQPGGKAFTVTSSGHLTNLHVMAQVAVNPKWSFDEWAIFAHRIGKDAEEVFDWAVQANGLDEYVFKLMQAKAKNASGQVGTLESSAPASTSVTAPPTKPSRGNR